MASRRDELNAYSFARKRTVASFLKPLPSGSMESAPRPLRTLLPTIILGMLILVGFGACGIIKPSAPQGWDSPGEKVIVGDKSTTRYVVLSGPKGKDGKPTKRLYPVLNLASAKLLLDPEKFDVVKVKESELDNGKITKGPTIGIPYAPDRLPSAEDAAEKKVWAYCERPGEKGQTQQATFVMSGDDSYREDLVDGPQRLDEKKSLYVQDEEGNDYLVDENGMAHRLEALFAHKQAGMPITPQKDAEMEDLLRRILFGLGAEPQKVSQQWMDTLLKDPLPIFFPPLESVAGQPAQTTAVPEEHRVIGRVLETRDDGGTQKFVVLKDKLAPVSDFLAELLLEGPTGALAGDVSEAVRVGQASIAPSKEGFMEKIQGKESVWPKAVSTRANNTEELDGKHVICSAYHGGEKEIHGQKLGVPDLSTWAGTEYPAPVSEGGRGSYVSPGSGLLYTEVTGKSKDGSLFLITDTGLRYAVQVNNDTDEKAGKSGQEVNQAQIRLGYQSIAQPPLVPKEWSQLLSAGPKLTTGAARQPQGA